MMLNCNAKWQMTLRKRKGALHTLEGIIAFIMVLTFIIFVLPYIKKDDSAAITRNYVLGSLSNLEKTGKLNNLMVAENLSGLSFELNRTLAAPLKFTVGLSKLNVSSGTVYPKSNEANYINFTANTSTLDSATLELNYMNATNPIIYLNGVEIARHAGDYSGRETLDSASNVVSGQNSILLNTSSNAAIDYRLRLVSSLELESPPGNKTIITVNYMVAGNESEFKPREIRVYIWR